MTVTILLVEDNKDVKIALDIIFKPPQYNLLYCQDVECAEKLLFGTKKKIDILLLDLALTERSGFDLLEQLRDRPGRERMGIIVVSGTDSAKAAFRAAKLGAHQYITKPFDKAEMREAVEELLKGRSTAKEEVR